MKRIKSAWRDCDEPMHFASHVFRIAFGILFILVAVAKLKMGYGGFANFLVNGAGPLSELPDFFLYAYGWIIPALELIVGLMLIFKTRVALAYKIIAVIYLTFIAGQLYDGNGTIVGNEYLPSLVALTVGYYAYRKTE